MQKLHDMTKKRLDELNNPKTAKAPKTKGVDLNLSPQDILTRMEQLKDKVSNEADPEESTRLIARIQALNASYVQLMGVDAASGPDGSGGGAANGSSVKERVEQDQLKYANELDSATQKEAELREELAELREKLDGAQPHIEQLRKERETCQDVVRTLRDKITAINEEWQGKFDEFKAATDKWFVEKDEVMKERCAPLAQIPALCCFTASDTVENLPHVHTFHSFPPSAPARALRACCRMGSQQQCRNPHLHAALRCVRLGP